MNTYILFLIISTGYGVTTEKISTTNLEQCESLLVEIKQVTKRLSIMGKCISE